MRRRVALALLAGAATAPPPVRGQTARPSRVVGLLMPYLDRDELIQARIAGLQRQLAELGWRAGETVRYETRWPGDDLARVRRDAEDLVALEVDVIVTTGSRVVPIVLQRTRTIPIVFAGVSDPVGQGLVANLARPGGNVTGFSLFEFDGRTAPVIGKMLELLKKIASTIEHAAIVYNPDNPATAIYGPSFEAAARALSLRPAVLPLRDSAALRPAIAEFDARPGGGLVFPSDLTLLANRSLITGIVAEHRVPAIFADTAFARSGGLVSYSPDRADMFVRAAKYVDRILRGERAGDLPVQQPTRYELVINLKAAAALGLAVPPLVLAQADDVID